MKTGRKTWVETDLILSEAFGKLTGQSPRVLLMFHTRRQTERVKARKKGERDEYRVINNGKLTFTYRDAAKKGISGERFRHALNQLIQFGFLDVTHPGAGLVGDPSNYFLSERWRDFGKASWVSVERVKGRQRVGFQDPQNRGRKKQAQENLCCPAQENLCCKGKNPNETAQENLCRVLR